MASTSHRIVGSLLLACALTGCAFFRKVTLNYTTANLPAAQVRYNVPYWASGAADQNKNRLDLFLPTGRDWPTLVFVHGGEWIAGDRSLRVLGADVYRNIGRFFASHGVGVAVISYRLLPDSDWKSQIMDVARSVKWVHQHIAEHHGNPRAIFIGGHSSGAQLAVRVALDPAPLLSLGSSSDIICGVIPISGAGYDLTDSETYAAAKKVDLFARMFRTDDISASLRRQLSPDRFITPHAPPFLIMYAMKEDAFLQNGSVTLHERLRNAGINSELFAIQQKNHKTIVLSLSQPQQVPTAAMLVFMKNVVCRH